MATMTHLPRTYREARDVYVKGSQRARGRRIRLGNNTYLHPRGGSDESASAYAVRLHNTDVVTFHKNGVIELYTGGWYSATTADRMHQFTPESVRVSYRWSGGDHRLVVSVADGREPYTDWQGETHTRLTFRELVTSRDGERIYLAPDMAGGVDTWALRCALETAYGHGGPTRYCQNAARPGSTWCTEHLVEFGRIPASELAR